MNRLTDGPIYSVTTDCEAVVHTHARKTSANYISHARAFLAKFCEAPAKRGSIEVTAKGVDCAAN